MPTPITSIQAFQEYFLSVKPYHTKILNILQRYVFFDTVNASLPDDLQFNIEMANIPLCKAVGFGINFDDCCGFSTTQCCDLFTCVGGYGIIFDNSVLTNSGQIVNVNSLSGTFTISGNQTYDTRIQILSYVSSNSIAIAGNQLAYLNKNQLFYIIPYNVLSVSSYTTNSITLSGNCAQQIGQRKELIIYGSGINDGSFYVISSIYNVANNTTVVVLDTAVKQLYPNISNMMIQFKQTTTTYNDGLYQSISAVFNGVNTVVTLNTNVNKIDFLNSAPGSILLHTGFLQNRIVTIENNGVNNGDYSIQFSSYNYITNQTTVQLNTYLNENYSSSSNIIGGGSIPTPTPSLVALPTANLYGYLTGPGFDGTPECNIPKDFNINTALSEKINIQIILAPTPTPSPSPRVALALPVDSNIITLDSNNNLNISQITDTTNNMISVSNMGTYPMPDRIMVLGVLIPSLGDLPTNGYYGGFFSYYGSIIFVPTTNSMYICDPDQNYTFTFNSSSTPPLLDNIGSFTIDSTKLLLWLRGRTTNNLYCYEIQSFNAFIKLDPIDLFDQSGQLKNILGLDGQSSGYGLGNSFGMMVFPTSDICIVSYNTINIFKIAAYNQYSNIQLELYSSYTNANIPVNTIQNNGIKVSQYSTLNSPYLFSVDSTTSGVDTYIYSYNPDTRTISLITSFPTNTFTYFLNIYMFVITSNTLYVYSWDGSSTTLITSSALINSAVGLGVAWPEYNLYRISTFGPESFDFDGTNLIKLSVDELAGTTVNNSNKVWAGVFANNPPPAVSPAITPSITPSVNTSPTSTPAISPTPLITPSITPTLSITPSVTYTQSTTPTISLTPSITPSINTSPTVTPTLTVFASITPTITVTQTPSPTVTPSISVS